MPVYIDPASWPNLAGATLQYVDSLSGGGFRFENPNKPRLLSDPLAARVQAILDEEINPGVAAHGGRIALMNVEDGRVFVKFGGGCQGCGQADVTLKEGVVATLTRQIPEIREVVDATDHSSGENPYY
ncbi:MAG: NifU family protein [Deltaproteobacteria bacterium]|nr:NifU family protein [Deltaproteobacteria bacterium]